LAIQIARLCPKLSFRLVLNRRDTRVYDDLTKNLPGNVCVTDYVPYRQVDELFRSTRCLLNTSDAEGFPNTYLQAASHGIPIVSLRVDPDGILTRHGCGRVVNGSVDAAATQLLEWYQNTASYCQAASAGPEFVRRFHLAADRCRELSELLLACKPTDRQPATPSDKQRELAA
jgi:glycosyltransferase involved in cell wall biosynthesis